MVREDHDYTSIVRLFVMQNSRSGSLTNKTGCRNSLTSRDLKNHRFGLLSVNYTGAVNFILVCSYLVLIPHSMTELLAKECKSGKHTVLALDTVFCGPEMNNALGNNIRLVSVVYECFDWFVARFQPVKPVSPAAAILCDALGEGISETESGAVVQPKLLATRT